MTTSLQRSLEALKSLRIPGAVKVVLSFATICTFILLADAWTNGLMVTQYLHLLMFVLAAGLTARIVDSLLTILLENPRSREGQALLAQIHDCLYGSLSLFGIDASALLAGSGPSFKVSPKKRQRLLQIEIEKYVQQILALYVRPWAEAISSTQTVDVELENDLRIALSAVADRLRNLDSIRLGHDLVSVAKAHCHRVKRAMEENGDCWEGHFVFLHPAFAKDRTEKIHLFLLAEKTLKRYRVHKSIPNKLALEWLCQIVNKQILVEIAKAAAELNLFEKKALSPNSESSHKLSSATTEAEELCKDEGCLVDEQSPGLGDAEISASDNNASANVDTKARTTVFQLGGPTRGGPDVFPPSGYIVKEEEPFAVAPPPSGRISAALGGLFSATAGPLLPENIAFKSFNKMWRSQSSEDLQPLGEKSSLKFTFPLKNEIIFHEHQQALTSSLTCPSTPRDEAPPPSSSCSKFLDFRSAQNLFLSGKKYLTKLPSVHAEDEVDEDQDDRYSPEPTSLRRHSTTAHQDVPTSNGNGDISRGGDRPSPNYEDNQDLESTISKLRTLLSEKSHNDSVGQINENDHLAREAITNGDDRRNPPEIPGDEESSQGSNILAASDLPTDGRLILNVRVPETEVVTLAGGGSSGALASSAAGAATTSNSGPTSLTDTHLLYCIRYDGIYLEACGPNENRYRYVIHSRLVKRRFKEFLNLQRSLEANSKLRMALKGIKGPNKWLDLPSQSLSISNAGSSTELEMERILLERWLESLCRQPQIVLCPELRQFLAYRDDRAAGSFFQKAGEAKGTKMEKISRTVSGVIHSLKDVLPTFEDHDVNSHNSNMPAILSSVDLAEMASEEDPREKRTSGSPASTPTFLFVPKAGSEVSEFESALETFSLRKDRKTKSVSSSIEESSPPLSSSWIPEEQLTVGPIEDWLSFQEDNEKKSLAVHLLETLAEGMALPWIKNVAVQLALVIFSDVVDKAIQDHLVSECSSDWFWAKQFRDLRHWIWGTDGDSEKPRDEDLEHWKLYHSSAWIQNSRRLLRQSGLDVSGFHNRVQRMLSSPRVNMELVLYLTDVIVMHLTEEQLDKM